jgi:hypothetical protein
MTSHDIVTCDGHNEKTWSEYKVERVVGIAREGGKMLAPWYGRD